MWSTINIFWINILAIFASSSLITSNKICQSFFSIESQKILSIFIPVLMLTFCAIIFSFISFIFFRSIFAIGIPSMTILYHFYANFALLSITFVQTSSSLNFSSSFLFVAYMAISLLSRVCSMWGLVVVILFFKG